MLDAKLNGELVRCPGKQVCEQQGLNLLLRRTALVS